MCELSFLLAEYSVELLVEYLSTWLILEVAMNYRVLQNKWISGSSVKIVVKERFEMSQNNARNASEIIIKHGCSLQNSQSV